MYLKKVEMFNIQSHEHTVLEFNDKGMTYFVGDNSHGKSVFTKTLIEALSGGLNKPKKRRSLKSKWASYGEVIMTRDDDVVLIIHIQAEAAETYMEYLEPDKQPIRRYLADKAFGQMLSAFGWHWDPTSGVCLNICDEWGVSLFFRSPRQNFAVASYALRDTRADFALENLNNAYTETKKYINTISQSYQTNKAILREMVLYNIEEQEERKRELQKCKNILECLNMPPFPTLKRPVDVVYLELKPFPTLKYPKIIALPGRCPDIGKQLLEIQQLQNGKCPTCGRKWHES